MGEVGLALALLIPPLHQHDDKRVHVLQEVGFRLGTECNTKCGPVFPLCFGLNPSNLIPIGLAWNYPQDHTRKVSCRNSIVDMPAGLGFTRFGSILDILSLHSNMHQNLWNSLDLVNLA